MKPELLTKQGVLMDSRKILLKAGGDKAIKIQVATAATWPKIRAQLSRVERAWAEAQNFTGGFGTCLQIPDGKGAVAEVVYIGAQDGNHRRLDWSLE